MIEDGAAEVPPTREEREREYRFLSVAFARMVSEVMGSVHQASALVRAQLERDGIWLPPPVKRIDGIIDLWARQARAVAVRHQRRMAAELVWAVLRAWGRNLPIEHALDGAADALVEIREHLAAAAEDER